MKIAVLGAGALGCYYGSRLVETGNDVRFIMRSEYDYVKTHGLQVRSLHGDISLPNVQVYRSPEEVGPVDLVIVAWKTTANSHLKEALPPLMGPGTIVLTLQNGMGNAEAIAQVIPAEKIFVGLCFICAMRTDPGVISHLEGGNIQFAPFIPTPESTAKAEELAELFGKAPIPTRAFAEAEKIQWFKLVWNIPFNGMCLAKGGISVGELYKDPSNVERARRIMEEVVSAAKARGYTLRGDLVDYHMQRTETMGGFTPSSAIDYNMGRPIEYEAIWGAPIAKAREAGASIPEWEQLDREIRKRLGMQPS